MTKEQYDNLKRETEVVKNVGLSSYCLECFMVKWPKT